MQGIAHGAVFARGAARGAVTLNKQAKSTRESTKPQTRKARFAVEVRKPRRDTDQDRLLVLHPRDEWREDEWSINKPGVRQSPSRAACAALPPLLPQWEEGPGEEDVGRSGLSPVRSSRGEGIQALGKIAMSQFAFGARVYDPQQLDLQGDMLRLTEPRSAN